MDGVAGEADHVTLRVTFDSRLKLEFHGLRVASDAGLLPFRDLDDALGVFQMAEVAVPRDLFRRMLDLIDDLRPRQVARC
jgi:hypothetical protein